MQGVNFFHEVAWQNIGLSTKALISSLDVLSNFSDYFHADTIVSSFNPPNIDEKFVEKYNQAARGWQMAAESFKLASFMIPGLKAFENFSRTLGTEIESKRDIWKGLDYRVAKEIGRNRLLYIPGKNPEIQIYLIPPEAGHNSKVIHYGEDKSIVQKAVQYGDVWVMDKMPAGQEHANFGLEECILGSAEAIRHIHNETGKKVDVVGFCEGGWEGVYAILLDQGACRSCGVGGSPFNWHSEDLSDLTKTINIGDKNHRKKLIKQRDKIEKLINKNEGIMPGLWNLAGFVYFSKEKLLKEDIENLWKASFEGDDDAMKRFMDFYPGWFMHPKPMPGKYFLEIFDRLYTENQGFRGELTVSGKKINLNEFRLPIYILNGKKDNVTSLGQQMDLKKKISTPKENIITDDVNKGHIGIFNSRESIKGRWEPWFKTVSHPNFGKGNFSIKEFYNAVSGKYAN